MENAKRIVERGYASEWRPDCRIVVDQVVLKELNVGVKWSGETLTAMLDIWHAQYISFNPETYEDICIANTYAYASMKKLADLLWRTQDQHAIWAAASFHCHARRDPHQIISTLFSSSLFIIPLHLFNTHWALAIVVHPDRLLPANRKNGIDPTYVYTLDSLEGAQEYTVTARRVIRLWLAYCANNFLGTNMSPDNLLEVSINKTAIQPNGLDCGPYVHHHLNTFFQTGMPAQLHSHYNGLATMSTAELHKLWHYPTTLECRYTVACQDQAPTPSRNSKLEALLAGPGRRTAPYDLWAKEATAEDKASIELKFQELVSEWQATFPNRKLEDNRLQLTQSAKRRVYEQRSAEGPTFVEKWEDWAQKEDVVSPKDQATLHRSSVRFWLGEAQRLRRTIWVSKGESLIDHSPESAWHQAMTPLIANFLGRIEGKGPSEVVLGNLIDKIQLVPYNLSESNIAKRLDTYFSANLRSVQGLKITPWLPIKNKPDLYLTGLPDYHRYTSPGKPISDPETGKPLRVPVEFAQPKNMSNATLQIYDKHIQ
ncbi:hypothetical protein FRB90_007599 [Tulasnella sp. 427]|nr:hypothetical protein FRB90_007599 [Tulasnella sp. 427]